MNEHWLSVAEVGAIPKNEGRKVVWRGKEVAIFNLGNEYRAVSNRCPHKAGPLADGIVSGKSVFCPLHNLNVSLEDGHALRGGTGCAKVYPVRVIDNKICVAFEANPSPADQVRK